MKLDPKKVLQQLIQPIDLPIHSRVHPLKIGNKYNVGCYIKRDDELGCLISGSKIRKFHSILKALKKRKCKKAGLIGSQFSNQVLGLSSLLIENDIEPNLFLLETKSDTQIGNSLFTQILVPKENIKIVPRDRWHLVNEMANKWQMDNQDFLAVIIPEGGSLKDSLPGLLTLPLDILRNEEHLGLEFQDILIDAGSGVTAACLIAAYGFLKKESRIHVMMAASDLDSFHQKVCDAESELAQLTENRVSYRPEYILYEAPIAPSFGSTNAKIFQTIAEVAKNEGFFLDPIYSAKLFLLLEKLLEKKSVHCPTLFIHSGGVFTLSGFQKQFTN